MAIKVYFFGFLAEKAGTSQWEAPVHADLEGLLEEVLGQFPPVANTAWVIAVNQTIVHDRKHRLAAGDEVALMPPFAGG